MEKSDKVKLKSYEDMLGILELSGYKECSRGNWHKDGNYPSFRFSTFEYCEHIFKVSGVNDDGTIYIRDPKTGTTILVAEGWVEKC